MISRTNPIIKLVQQSRPKLHLEQTRTAFYNKYRHGPHKLTNPDIDYTSVFKGLFFSEEGRKGMVRDIKVMVKKPFEINFNKRIEPNQTKIFEDFDSHEAIKRWKPVADRDGLNGFSVSQFSRSPAGHGLFHGVIDNTLPDDGMTANSGFAAVIGPHAPREWFFKVEQTWDWSEYNCLELKFRGDGRKYAVVLSTGSAYEDLGFYDNYSFPIYTRGGPYWQTCRIGFSKFLYNYKSFIQDRQGYLPTLKIQFVAIAVHDSVDGPFALELDYIGLRHETKTFNEITPYEMYRFAHLKMRPLQVECEAPETN